MTTPLVPQFVFDFTLLSNIMKIKMSREKRKKKEKKKKRKEEVNLPMFFLALCRPYFGLCGII
jgi:hypothetical protein